MVFQLKKKTIAVVAVVIFILSLGATGYIVWTVENEEDITPQGTSAMDDYYQKNMPIFEDICGDGFMREEYDEECEFSDPAGYECEWDDGCNQSTCKCEAEE